MIFNAGKRKYLGFLFRSNLNLHAPDITAEFSRVMVLRDPFVGLKYSFAYPV